MLENNLQFPLEVKQVREAFSNANFTKKSLDETLDEIIDKVYWKGAKEQK